MRPTGVTPSEAGATYRLVAQDGRTLVCYTIPLIAKVALGPVHLAAATDSELCVWMTGRPVPDVLNMDSPDKARAEQEKLMNAIEAWWQQASRR